MSTVVSTRCQITDFGRRQLELSKLSKYELGEIIAKRSGMWPEMNSRTRESLRATINMIESHCYDCNGGLK